MIPRHNRTIRINKELEKEAEEIAEKQYKWKFSEYARYALLNQIKRDRNKIVS